jgi:hypothetical protein
MVTPKGVLIGGDSAGVNGYDVRIREDAKVFVNGPFLIGYTSSFRMGQLLRFRFSPANQSDHTDDYEYMATVFVDAVRECFGTYGIKHVENEVESGGSFLVGYRGRLYEIESDFQVGMYADGYSAVGCGASYALGSLATSDGKTPRLRVQKALEVAERFSAGVRSPFVIEELRT